MMERQSWNNHSSLGARAQVINDRWLAPLRFRCIVLSTLTLLFGLQVFRVYLPSILWYLGQYLNGPGLVLYGLATLAPILAVPFLVRWLQPRRMLVLTVVGLALVRLAIQVFHAPAADLVLSTVGVVLFGLFIPQWCQSRQNCTESSETPVLAVAFPLAFLLDTASRSLLFSYDLAWRNGIEATLVVLTLVVVLLYVLWRELKVCTIWAEYGQISEEPGLGSVLPMLGLGPWLFISMTVTHNPAALAGATGWKYGAAHLAVNAFTALGVIACVWVAGWSVLQRWYWALAGGFVLVLSLALLVSGIGPAWLWVGLAAVNSWAALGEVLTSTARTGRLHVGLWRTGVVSFVAMVVLLFILVLSEGFSLLWIVVVAAVILSLAALWATRLEPGRDREVLIGRAILVGTMAGGVVLIVAVWTLLTRSPQTTDERHAERPLRVMTYNIHHGLDADYGMDLEQIIDVIAMEDPDVVVLNEVNRARLTNGFVDTLLLISRRLDMPYVFGPNYQDGQYGNAILSRYPVLTWDNTPFASKTTEVRSMLRAVVQHDGEPITFFATHLDHLEGPDNVRSQQVVEALDVWDGSSRAVLLGDLNAEPDAPELQAIYEAGFVDALAANGQGDAFTFWDTAANRRLDFIFVTPDLLLGQTWVIPTRASDHLPVIAEIGP